MTRRRSSKWTLKRLQKAASSVIGLALKILPFGLIAGFAYYFFLSAHHMVHADLHFQVKRITASPPGVLNKAEIQFLEQKIQGKSLLEVNLKEISSILERDSRIRRAEVSRVLPDELSVLLTLRVPLFQVRPSPEGKYLLVSDDQMVLGSVNTPRPDLVVLEDFSSSRKIYAVGSLYENQYFRLLFKILAAIKSDPFFARETVSKLSIDPIGNIALILKDGVELKVGREWALSSAARTVLDSLLRSEQRNQILYLDLRYRDIIVKRKS